MTFSLQAYAYARKTFHLPDPSTLRRWTSNSLTLPGFQEESFKDIERRMKEDEERAEEDKQETGVCLQIDGMSVKESIQTIHMQNQYNWNVSKISFFYKCKMKLQSLSNLSFSNSLCQNNAA